MTRPEYLSARECERHTDVTHARSAPSVAEEAKVPFVLHPPSPFQPPFAPSCRPMFQPISISSILLSSLLSDPSSCLDLFCFSACLSRFLSSWNSFADKLFKVFSASFQLRARARSRDFALLLFETFAHSQKTALSVFSIVQRRFRYKTSCFRADASAFHIYPFDTSPLFLSIQCLPCSLLCIVYIIRSCSILSPMGEGWGFVSE